MIDLPATLLSTIEGWPNDDARDWANGLPATIADAQRRWSITVGEPFEPGGVVSYAAPATSADGGEAVYKCTIPHTEAVGEALALEHYAGDGAVKVLASARDTYELLVERCRPGDSAWSIVDREQRTEVIAELMARLWRPASTVAFRTLASLTAEWADVTEERFEEFALDVQPGDRPSIEYGIHLLRTLPASAPKDVLLHQDLHPGNVLSAEREPWLVIDPKPVVGDPAFDPIQFIVQRDPTAFAMEPDGFDAESAVARVSELLGLDPSRVAAWGCARSAEWAMWDLGVGASVLGGALAAWATTFMRLAR